MRYFLSHPYANEVCLCGSSWVINVVTSWPAKDNKISFPPGCRSRNSLISYTFPRWITQKSFSVLCCCTSTTENWGSSILATHLFASLYIRRVQITKSKVCLQVPRGPFIREDWGELCQQSAATPMDCMISIEVSWFSAGVFDQIDSFLLWIWSLFAVSWRERTVPPSGWIPTWLQRIYDGCSWISLWRNTNTPLSLPRLPFHMKTQPCCLQMLGWIR